MEHLCWWATETKGTESLAGWSCFELLVEASVRVAFVAGGKAQRIPKPMRLAMGGDRLQQESRQGDEAPA